MSLARDDGLILTSRRPEYRDAVSDAGDVLTAAAVIAPLALSGSDAAKYLKSHLPPARLTEWKQLLCQLESGKNRELAAVTATPFGLWLIRTVYVDGRLDSKSLSDPILRSRPGLQSHLLDQLIPAVIGSRPPRSSKRQSVPSDGWLLPSRAYDETEVHRWLTAFAEQLRRAGSRDWLWWELAHRAFPRVSTRLFAALFLTVPWLLLIGIPFSLMAPWSDDGSALLRISGDGYLVAVALGCGVRLHARPRRAVFGLRGRWSAFLRGVSTGLLAAASLLAFSLLLLSLLGLYWRTPDYVLFVIAGAIGVPLGAVAGVVAFISSPAVTWQANSPLASYRSDRFMALARGCSAAIGAGPLLLAVVFNQLLEALLLRPSHTNDENWLASELALTIVYIVVATFAVRTAWGNFFITRTRLILYKQAPRNLMRFLDDAHRLGLLRVVGPAYQFRHAELQDHLAPPLPRLDEREPRTVPSKA